MRTGRQSRMDDNGIVLVLIQGTPSLVSDIDRRQHTITIFQRERFLMMVDVIPRHFGAVSGFGTRGIAMVTENVVLD